MKKFIALTLSIVMLLSCMSLTVFAGNVPLADEIGDYITDEIAALIKQDIEEQRAKDTDESKKLKESIKVLGDLEYNGNYIYTFKEGTEGKIQIKSDYGTPVMFVINSATTAKNGEIEYKTTFNRWIGKNVVMISDKINPVDLLTVSDTAKCGTYPVVITGRAYALDERGFPLLDEKKDPIETDVELVIQIVVGCSHQEGETRVVLQKATLFGEGTQVVLCNCCGETLRVEVVPAVLLDFNGYGLFMAIVGILKLLFPTLFSPEVTPTAP